MEKAVNMNTRIDVMIRITKIGFILLTSAPYICKCNSCPATTPTVQIVDSCPTTEEEWNAASNRKKCYNLADYKSCGKTLVYHCLLNQWGNETLDVCAPPWYISGFCPMFNTAEQRVIDNFNIDCTKFSNGSCPTRYLSSEAYKFQKCYKKQITLSSASSTNAFGQKDNMQSNVTDSNDDQLTLVIIAVLMSIAVLVLSVLLALTCKGKLGRKGFENDRDNKRKDQENTVFMNKTVQQTQGCENDRDNKRKDKEITVLMNNTAQQAQGHAGQNHPDGNIAQLEHKARAQEKTNREHHKEAKGSTDTEPLLPKKEIKGHAGQKHPDKNLDQQKHKARIQEITHRKHHVEAEGSDTEPLLNKEDMKDATSDSTVLGGETYAEQITARQKDLNMLAGARMVSNAKINSNDSNNDAKTKKSTDGPELTHKDEKHATDQEGDGNKTVDIQEGNIQKHDIPNIVTHLNNGESTSGVLDYTRKPSLKQIEEDNIEPGKTHMQNMSDVYLTEAPKPMDETQLSSTDERNEKSETLGDENTCDTLLERSGFKINMSEEQNRGSENDISFKGLDQLDTEK